MKAIHDLFDGRGVVPKMDIKDVDIRCAQLLQARLDAYMKVLDRITAAVDLDLDFVVRQFVRRAVLHWKTCYIR